MVPLATPVHCFGADERRNIHLDFLDDVDFNVKQLSRV